jgi:hypothetical protein
MLMLLISINGLSQTQKGTLLLGGSAGVQFSDPFSVNFNPNVGVFVLDKLAIGSSLSSYFSSETRYRYSQLGIGPFVRYYFGEKKLQYFVLADVGLYRNWYKVDNPPFEERRQVSNFWNARAGLGAVYFITQQIGLEATLYYRINDSPGSDNSDSNLFLNFGLQIYLPSGKE